MKLTPVLTEKSLSCAKEGKYTFLVEPGMGKLVLKSTIGKVFGVTVKSVRVITISGGLKKNARGRIQKIPGQKKAIVVLKKGDKIDLFEEKGKTKK